MLHFFLEFVVGGENYLDQAAPVAVDRLRGRSGPEVDARAWVDLPHVSRGPLGVAQDGGALADGAVDGRREAGGGMVKRGPEEKEGAETRSLGRRECNRARHISRGRRRPGG